MTLPVLNSKQTLKTISALESSYSTAKNFKTVVDKIVTSYNHLNHGKTKIRLESLEILRIRMVRMRIVPWVLKNLDL